MKIFEISYFSYHLDVCTFNVTFFQPGYQNLKNRVDRIVKDLIKMKWSPTMNKNQMRAKLRQQFQVFQVLKRKLSQECIFFHNGLIIYLSHYFHFENLFQNRVVSCQVLHFLEVRVTNLAQNLVCYSSLPYKSTNFFVWAP